jgi:O-acetyl-ADP-ribose deacetylase (regulator of RNase III)
MLKITEGNLWTSAAPPCVVAHGCNPLGKMGAGFAKEVQDRFPENFLEYRQWCFNGRVKVGQWLLVHESDFSIFNLITQETYGNDPAVVYVDYEAVEKGLKVVAEYGQTYKLPIHLPFIGAGKANGDPKRLRAIMEEVFAETDAMLYLRPPSKKASQWPPPTF